MGFLIFILIISSVQSVPKYTSITNYKGSATMEWEFWFIFSDNRNQETLSLVSFGEFIKNWYQDIYFAEEHQGKL